MSVLWVSAVEGSSSPTLVPSQTSPPTPWERILGSEQTGAQQRIRQTILLEAAKHSVNRRAIGFDDDVAQRLVDSRTPTRADAARWGAHVADTEVKIIVTVLLAVGAIAVWRRWHEALLIVAALVMEATAFIIASFIVGRPRPDVPRLLDSPVDSSFPSGHVAAATVYSVVVVVVFRHTRSRLARTSVGVPSAIMRP